MDSNNLSAVIACANISKHEACEAMQVSIETLDGWLSGLGEPSWRQSLKLMFYMASKLSSYNLPQELDLIEEMEKEICQASSTCDLLFQSMDENSIAYGATWGLSDKLKGLMKLVKQCE